MAGYLKVWTSLRSNDGYLSLSGLCRGAYLQLLLWCKSQRDDGTVTASGWTQVGVELGVDRRTARHVCDKIAAKLLLTHDKNAQGVITIQFHNYKQWQEITVNEVLKKSRGSVQKCTPPRLDQTRLDQTRPDQTKLGKPPVKEIRNLYIEICQGFPEPQPIEDWSSKRYGNVNARWKMHPDLTWWRTYFERVAASEFLGKATENWGGADFGWIMLPSNMEKILEGRYDNKTKAKQQLTSEKDYGTSGERQF